MRRHLVIIVDTLILHDGSSAFALYHQYQDCCIFDAAHSLVCFLFYSLL